MDLKRLVDTDDRGVSPVIGVILMVAITVILAAVIATFVMNIGPPENTAPNTQIDITNETTHFSISHAGGNAIPASEVVIQLDDTGYDLDSDVNVINDTWTAGSPSINTTANLSTPVDSPPDVDTIRIIWENPGGDETQILKEFDN